MSTGRPDLPPPTLAGRHGRRPDKVRHPVVLFRVRWTRSRWHRRDGYARWSVRYLATWRAAENLAQGLLADGAEVEVSSYHLNPLDTLRYTPKPPPPPSRRPRPSEVTR